VKRSLNAEYKQGKEEFGVICSLENDMASSAILPEKPKPSSPKTKAVVDARSESSKAEALAKSLIQLTDAFCQEALNEEYAVLCRKLSIALARKRPSPLLQGRLSTWAAGVVRTIGWTNFLNDPSQNPHLKLSAIDYAFGISESTGTATSKKIRDLFKIRQFDPKWTLPSKLDDNPLVWMLKINGFILDIRLASRELQEAAFKKKLIPYIPADRDNPLSH
jgi:Domain of unknown function (DUF6398)